MKKLLILMLSFTMIFTMSSCDLFELTDSNSSVESSLSDGADDATSESSSSNDMDENSEVSLPTIEGENELPLIPIG